MAASMTGPRYHRDDWPIVAAMSPLSERPAGRDYLRVEDETRDRVATAPTSLELGIIDYRKAIKLALAQGFSSALLCEHDVDDGLSVSATNRDCLRRILPRAPNLRGATP